MGLGDFGGLRVDAEMIDIERQDLYNLGADEFGADDNLERFVGRQRADEAIERGGLFVGGRRLGQGKTGIDGCSRTSVRSWPEWLLKTYRV